MTSSWFGSPLPPMLMAVDDILERGGITLEGKQLAFPQLLWILPG